MKWMNNMKSHTNSFKTTVLAYGVNKSYYYYLLLRHIIIVSIRTEGKEKKWNEKLIRLLILKYHLLFELNNILFKQH